MKKINLLIVALVTFSLAAQDPTSNLQLNTSGDYLRPGVSIIQLNFNNSPSEFNINSVPFPLQFDGINFGNEFSYNSDYNSETKYKSDESFSNNLTQYVKNNLSGKFIDAFLGVSNGTPNWQNLFQRANNSLTESQRSEISSLSNNLSTASQDLLLDALIDNNYLVVIMPGSIESSTSNGDTTYGMYSVVAVFKIDVAEGVDIQAKKNLFMSTYSSNFDEVKSSVFPTELTFINTVYAADSDAESVLLGRRPTYEEIIAGINSSTISNAIVKSSQKVVAFKPRSNVYDKMEIRLGTKEGLKVGDRYYSYERQLNTDGSVELKRKGVDRIKYVGNNSLNIVDASEEDLNLIERSKLALDSGKPTRTGYLSMYEPDLGFGVSAIYRLYPGIRIDLRLDNIALGLQAFLEAEIEKAGTLYAEDNFYTYTYEDATAAIGYVGLQYYLGLSRTIDIVPFASYGIPKWFDSEGEEIEIEGSIINAGIRVPLKLGPSLQLMPELTYLISDSYGYDLDDPENKIFIGGSLRFNF